MKLKLVNLLISICSLGIFITCYINEIGIRRILLCSLSIIMFLFFMICYIKKDDDSNVLFLEKENLELNKQITELALLNDENKSIAFWEMYGKTSLVIGLDLGENKVDVNLLNTTYASMIDVEHAVLNYSNGNWYIEDIGSVNGTSIIKSDGKKYKLTSGKPCFVEKGDILCISLAKLKLC
ncbi:MAG TPA: FHA domain-containing protein [Candidatus Dwaynia gallinarum]|nr:FHA domain-containing protein [Candidatus Dwaynia gallinarum]